MTIEVPPTVFHYTNHLAFTKILEGGEIWAHDSNLSNDRREKDYASSLIALAMEEISDDPGFDEHLGGIHELIKDPFDPFQIRNLNEYLLIASFSEESNLLSQWRAYAPENGYAIGFETGKLISAAQRAGFSFGQVIYDFDRAFGFFIDSFRSYLQECVKNGSEKDSFDDDLRRLTSFIDSLIPLVKHPSFSEEKEWRLFRTGSMPDLKFYAGRRSLTPYAPINLAGDGLIPLNKVTIGPSDDPHALAVWTRTYLEQLGYKAGPREERDGVEIVVGGSPYRLK